MFERRLGHGVERIGDDDEDRVRRDRRNLVHHVRHDLVVGVQQVVAAHAGLARDAGGDDDDVGVRGLGVVVRADDVHVALLDRHGFEQVERLALRDAFRDIDQDDVRQFLRGDPVGGGRAYIACSTMVTFLRMSLLLCSATSCFRSFAWRTRWSSPWSRPASGARSRR